MILLFPLNSPCIYEGQGQSNSEPLFWILSELVEVGFLLIRETNRGGHVGVVRGEKRCNRREQRGGSKAKTKYVTKRRTELLNILGMSACHRSQIPGVMCKINE